MYCASQSAWQVSNLPRMLLCGRCLEQDDPRPAVQGLCLLSCAAAQVGQADASADSSKQQPHTRTQPQACNPNLMTAMCYGRRPKQREHQQARAQRPSALSQRPHLQPQSCRALKLEVMEPSLPRSAVKRRQAGILTTAARRTQRMSELHGLACSLHDSYFAPDAADGRNMREANGQELPRHMRVNQ